jgi:hypothetical protein
MLLFTSEEWEEPPFKPSTDIGWLWRAYCLAYDVADSIRGSIGHPNNPRVSVPDDEHIELQEIVAGLSLFSERRVTGRSHRYVCLVQAIVEACEGVNS